MNGYFGSLKSHIPENVKFCESPAEPGVYLIANYLAEIKPFSQIMAPYSSINGSLAYGDIQRRT
jgi:hypothetical protein